MPMLRLLIVEGIMGSGKSTTSASLARKLRAKGCKARLIPEDMKHPTTLTIRLKNYRKPWEELSAAEFSDLWLARWQTFVNEANAKTVHIFDGQFFHGDITSLLLMDTPEDEISRTYERLCAMIAPLNPALVYLYQNDVRAALERIASLRNPRWVKRQIEWKVDSPYCERRGYTGKEGWIALYQDYRALTDRTRSVESAADAGD